MLLSTVLFLTTVFSTTTLGAGWYLSTRTDLVTELLPFLTLGTIRSVWTDPATLAVGLSFSLPVMFILLCHEMGHYFACRRHGLPATLPYFIPAPFFLGTLGAFIRIRSPIRTRRQLLDVGAAGPIAGFLALLPFLVLGISRAKPSPILFASEAVPGSLALVVPGSSLLVAGLEWVFHGRLPADTVLNLPPFALAAWVGLLVTTLNLLPLGQLDGGHLVYAIWGDRHGKISWVFWIALAVAGFAWPGWWVWCAIILILGRRHPRIGYFEPMLDAKRRLIAWICFAIFVLSFMLTPLDVVIVAG